MKRKILTLILTIVTMIVSICGLFACGMVDFKVNFVVDGVVYDTINTNGEEIIKMPENPMKDEYTFDGWFWDKDTWQTPFTANSLLDAPLSSDMNVYCKWKANTVNVESVSLDQTEISLHENDVTYLTATVLPENATDTSVVWESSNSTIATVVGGRVTALRIGSATITATTKDGGKIATCNVYVEPITVESVTLNHTALSLLHGESKTLTATVLPSNATEKGVLWQSSNSSVVMVENGTVKAVGYGTATITVTTVDGNKKATCSVEVIEDKITFNTLAVDGESVYGKVSNATTTFSFIREITEHGNATYQVYKEITCETLIASKSISLIEGDNTVYVLQTVGRDLKLYTVTVRRRPMYDVTFNVNGGTAVEKQVIEEEYLATEPTTTRAGYTFTAWNYDFTKPIMQDTTVNAGWTAHTDTPYKVEYYLQNLEDDEYTLELTENKTGTTDTMANAEIKTFAHFTHTASATDSGNINGDGSTVLKVYYTRNKYTVTFEGNGGTLVGGAESQTVKYGGSVNAPMYQRTGYTFTGYDKPEFTNISESFTATAKWKINQYSLTIVYGNGQEDKVITQDYNSEIESIADPEREGYDFIGWDKTIPTEMPAENMTITARWKINQYSLTIVYGNGQEDKVITQDYNSKIESIVYYPEREGYDFIGWDKTIPTEMPAENVTVTAKWQSIYTLSNGTITGLTDYGKTNCTELDIPSEIDGVEITSIGNSAFEGCSSLTSIKIPGSVTSIGAWAFEGCSSLTNVTCPLFAISSIPKGNLQTLVINSGDSIGDSAFSGCSSLRSITIPDSVTSIDGYAFRDCDSLQFNEYGNAKYLGSKTNDYFALIETKNKNFSSYTIHNDTKIIALSAFYNCSSLTSIEIPDSVTSIGNAAFQECSRLMSVKIGNGVTSIGNSTFRACSSLTRIEIPDSVTSIGKYAFDNCSSLRSIEIPDSVTSIGAYAFESCSSLTSITIPDGVTSIGEYAFKGCRMSTATNNLRYIGSKQNPYLYLVDVSDTSIIRTTIKSTCKWIGDSAFAYCKDLTSIEIPNSVTSIGDSAFFCCSRLMSVKIGNGVTSIGYSTFYGCSSLTSVTIPDSVTSIGTYAFSGCSSLRSIEIPDSVTSIGDYAFRDCDGLTSITIPDSVTSIGDYAFRDCSSLRNITIPDSVTSIGFYAFRDCSSLRSIMIPDSVTSIDDYAFRDCSSLTSIMFNGTKAQWNAIEKGYNWEYNVPATKVVCSDGEVAL